jgi:protein TonB
LASYLLPLERDRPPLRRRLSGLAAALAVNLLLLLALLRMGIIPLPEPRATQSTIVDLLPADSAPTAAPQPSPARAKHAAKSPVAPRKPPPEPEKPKLPSLNPMPLLTMSKEDLAAADLSNISKAAQARGEGDSETVGRGPNGELLYAAEWAREPTDAELSGYLPKNAPNGSGLVACRTIPGDRVDDCIELANDPPGSHLASAVRQAAWQFRVRPPRKGGKELVGSWVRIRIDYYHSGS